MWATVAVWRTHPVWRDLVYAVQRVTPGVVLLALMVTA